VAESRGLFAAEGLDVTLRTARADSLAAEMLAQGQADVAVTSLVAMLRFGPRLEHQGPVVVFGLTAAPPVALLASTSAGAPVAAVAGLAGRRVGVAAPGVAEQVWLAGVLAAAGLKPTRVDVVSLGSRRVATAIESGSVDAGLVHEPAASALLADGRARLLADFRSPDAVRRALGGLTVNAAAFVQAHRAPEDAVLAAFGRALLAARRLLVETPAGTLAATLPQPLVGNPEEFPRRLAAGRELWLSDGLVTPERLRRTIGLIRAHTPLPETLRLPAAEDMLRIPVTGRDRPAPR